MSSMTHLSADPAILLLTVGLLLIYYELNRPGSVLPGAIGLLGMLLAIISLTHLQRNDPALTLILTGILLLTLDLIRPTGIAVAIAATLSLTFGLYQLTGTGPVHTVTSVGCGLTLGGVTSLLTRIARRARANKAVD